jgi:hypothetical protein
VLADMIIALGAAVTLQDMFGRFVGHSMAHCLELVRGLIGREVPAAFEADYRARRGRALEKPRTSLHEWRNAVVNS